MFALIVSWLEVVLCLCLIWADVIFIPWIWLVLILCSMILTVLCVLNIMGSRIRPCWDLVSRADSVQWTHRGRTCMKCLLFHLFLLPVGYICIVYYISTSYWILIGWVPFLSVVLGMRITVMPTLICIINYRTV